MLVVLKTNYVEQHEKPDEDYFESKISTHRKRLNAKTTEELVRFPRN